MYKRIIFLIVVLLALFSLANAQEKDDLLKSIKVTSVFEDATEFPASVSFEGNEIIISVDQRTVYIIVEGELAEGLEEAFIITDLQYTSVKGKFRVVMPKPEFFEIRSAEKILPVQKNLLLDEKTIADIPLQMFIAGLDIGISTVDLAIEEQKINYQETNLGGFPILATMKSSFEAVKLYIPEINILGFELFKN